MKEAEVIFLALIAAVLSAVVTYIVVSNAWQSDCEQIGQTRSGGKVYECKLKEVKK